MTLSIRRIGPEHSHQMLRILAASPMAAKDLTMCLDRQPDYSLYSRLHFDEFRYVGAFQEDRLVGFLELGFEQAHVAGKPETVFSIAHTYRERGLGKQNLVLQFLDFLFGQWDSAAAVGYAAVLKGNLPIERVAEVLTGGAPPPSGEAPPPGRVQRLPIAGDGAVMETYPILITLGKPEGGPFEVREANASDIDGMVALLAKDFAGRTFGPVVTRERLLSWIGNRPGFGLDSFVVAHRKGELVGVCSFWDTSSFKQTKVLHYGARMKVTKALYNVGALLCGFTPFPRVGEAFSEVNVSEYAARDRDPEIMRAMLRRIYNRCRARKVQLLNFGSARGDPLLEARKGFFTERVDSVLVLCATSQRRLDELQKSLTLPFLNVALV